MGSRHLEHVARGWILGVSCGFTFWGLLVELVGLVIFVFEGKYGHLAKRSVERENGGQIKRVKGKLGYRVKRKW